MVQPAVRERLGPYAALGHAFVVESAHPALLEALAPVVGGLPGPPRSAALTTYAIAEHDDPANRYRLYRGGTLVGSVPYFARIVAGLLWCVDREIAAKPPEGQLLLHAAAVASGGQSVVLPGASGSGKSTLAASLAGSGMGYLTDEVTAVSTATGEVAPYGRPLCLKPGSWALFPGLEPPALPGPPDPDSPWSVPADAVGRNGGAAASPVGVVVFPEYRPDAEPSVERLGRADALVALTACSFAEPPLAATTFVAFSDLARRTPCYRIRFGDVDWAAGRVRAIAAGAA